MLAQSVGCNRVIVESDCLEMLNTMLDGARSQGIAAAIFDDCYYLSTECINIQFDHVPLIFFFDKKNYYRKDTNYIQASNTDAHSRKRKNNYIK